MRTVCVVAVLALLVAAPLSVWSAQEPDGAQVFKTKCAACHGDNAEGKPAMKFPAAKGTSMTAEQLVTYLTKGESGKRIHAKPIPGLTEDQAKAVAGYVKELK